MRESPFKEASAPVSDYLSPTILEPPALKLRKNAMSPTLEDVMVSVARARLRQVVGLATGSFCVQSSLWLMILTRRKVFRNG